MLQQEHTALQAGAVALQRDRDYLIKQLRMTQAELDFITGSKDMEPRGALRSCLPCNPKPATILNSAETGDGNSGPGHVECSATMRESVHGRPSQVQLAGGRKSIRAIETLKAALSDHVNGPFSSQASSALSAGMSHSPKLKLISCMPTSHAMLSREVRGLTVAENVEEMRESYQAAITKLKAHYARQIHELEQQFMKQSKACKLAIGNNGQSHPAAHNVARTSIQRPPELETNQAVLENMV